MREIGPILVIIFVLVRIISAAITASKKQQQQEAQSNETEEQKRVREIQERIRKKIAERQGGVTPPPLPQQTAQAAPTPPLIRPMTSVPPLEPFGGPARRIIGEMKRRVEAAASKTEASEQAILQRQQRLADEMRALEAARAVAERRALQVVAEKEAAAATAQVAAQRASWLADVRDPKSLRRAILLREVLGPPVALR